VKEKKLFTDPASQYFNLYELDTTVDMGLRNGEANIIAGTIWEDNNRNGIFEQSIDSGYNETGVENIDVNLIPYIWLPEGEESEGNGQWKRVSKIEGAEKGDPYQWELVTIATDSNAEYAEGVLETTTTESGQYLFRNLPVEASVKIEDRADQTYLMGYRVNIPDLPTRYTITPMHNYPLDAQEGKSYHVSDLDKDAFMHSYEDKKDGVGDSFYILASVLDPDDGNVHVNTKTVGIMTEEGLKAVTYDTDIINPQENVDGGILPYSKAEIAGVVWDDVSKDNIRQPEEKGVDGVKVMLQYRLTATDSNGEPQDPYLVSEDGDYLSIFSYKFKEFDVEAEADQKGLIKDVDYWFDNNYIIPKNQKAEQEFEEMAREDKLRRQGLLEEAARLRREVQEIKEDSKEEFEKLEKVEQQKKDLEDEIASLLNKNTDLTSQYDALAIEADQITLQINYYAQLLAAKRDEIGRFMDAHSAERSEFEELKQNKDKAQKELTQNAKLADEKKDLIKDLEKEITEAEGSIDKAEKRIAEIEKRLAELGESPVDPDEQSEKDELEGEKTSLQETITDLESTISSNETKIADTEDEIRKLEEENAELQSDIETYTKKINEKQPDIDRIEAELKQLEADAEELEKKGKELNKTSSNLMNQMAYIMMDKIDCKERMEECQQELQRAEKSLVEQSKIVDAIEKRISEKTAAAEALEAEADIWYFSYLMCITTADGRYSFADVPLFDETLSANPIRNKEEEEAVPYTFRIVTEKHLNMDYVKLHIGDDRLHDSDVGAIANKELNGIDLEKQEALAAKYGAIRENMAISQGFTPLQPNKDWYSVYDGVYGLYSSRSDKTHDIGLNVYDWYSQLGGTIWRDDNHDGIMDNTEQGIANVPVSLYRYGRYEEGSEPVYYTYEVIGKEDTATASNATASNADKQSTTVRLTGKRKMTFGWIPVEDAAGKSVAYTDENGKYRFKVPVTDPDNPVEPYLYKVSVDKGEGEQNWSPFTNGMVEDAVSNDVIPSDQFIHLKHGCGTLNCIIEESGIELDEDGYIPEGTVLIIPGVYDPAVFKGYVPKGMIDPEQKEEIPQVYSIITPEFELEEGAFTEGIGNAAVSLVGNSVGLETDREELAVSHVFSLMSMEKKPGSRFVDLSSKRDDLYKNGGILKEIIPPDEPEDPVVVPPDKPNHHGDSSGSERSIRETIKVSIVEPLVILKDRVFNPKMGYSDYVWTALLAIALALLALYISRRKKK